MPQPERVSAQSRFEKTIRKCPDNHGFNRVGLFNIAMLAIAAAFLLIYVIGANKITAQNYKAKLLNEKLFVLNEATAKLMLNKNSFDNSARVLEFAQGRNMIEAKNITYLFENREVAIQR